MNRRHWANFARRSKSHGKLSPAAADKYSSRFARG